MERAQERMYQIVEQRGRLQRIIDELQHEIKLGIEEGDYLLREYPSLLYCKEVQRIA